MENDFLIQYPVWELFGMGGGFLIAFIATLHVYIAHFAVGGGLFLVLTEMTAIRNGSPALMEYTRFHGRFFMLLTLVLGGITGVGIWFTISVISPGATEILIRRFFFAWTAEWSFFFAEIFAIIVYYYTFDTMNKKDHVRVGLIYFICAWLSLFFINGIITFMLTPGKWTETGNFWHGFFNPSHVPSLFFRTAIAFLFAGLFGYITAFRIKDEKARESIRTYLFFWVFIPLCLVLFSGYIYLKSLPSDRLAMIFETSYEIMPAIRVFLWVSPLLFVSALFASFYSRNSWYKTLTAVMIILGFVYMGAFEWTREAARRPYLIHGHMYSNGILKKDLDAVSAAGLLPSWRWAGLKETAEDNLHAKGKQIFNLTCSSCHARGGPMHDIIPLTRGYTRFGMQAHINGIGKRSSYMPPFSGTDEEKEALAAYITESLNPKRDPFLSAKGSDRIAPARLFPFDAEKDRFVLLAAADLGMRLFTDSVNSFSLGNPAGSVSAQLIERGDPPFPVMTGVDISLCLEKEMIAPEGRPPGQESRIFPMKWDGMALSYTSGDIPLTPFCTSGTGHPCGVNLVAEGGNTKGYNPYPLATITAKDKKSGKVLARVKTAVPVSVHMGCVSCHGGKVRPPAGMTRTAPKNILKAHDRHNGTNLSGTPARNCGTCHKTPSFPGQEQEENTPLNLSAAIHGFHNLFLEGTGDAGCKSCHTLSPAGISDCVRGIHKEVGLGCTNCHGSMRNHSLGLLYAEKEEGKKAADKLISLITQGESQPENQAGRKPWIQEPDCLHCHVDFQPPETDMVEYGTWTEAAYELYRNRMDDAGIRCLLCHGSPHAIYPAKNAFLRESLVPLALQDNPYPIAANRNCRVCHTREMETELHHPNSLADFRNIVDTVSYANPMGEGN